MRSRSRVAVRRRTGFGGPPSASRAVVECGVPGDDQVWVGGVRPAVASVVQPVEDDLVGEVVERADVPGDAQAAVAEVDVVEAELADGLGPGGVDGGQREDDSDSRVGLGCGDGLVDVVRLQRQDRSGGGAADADPDGGVAEDRAVGSAVSKQRP